MLIVAFAIKSVGRVGFDDGDDAEYTAYIRMEKSLVGRVGLKGLRVGLSLCAYDDDGRGYCEDMVHMDPDDPSTWIRLER